jgi:transcriptional regulator with XRE-family HTH domain
MLSGYHLRAMRIREHVTQNQLAKMIGKSVRYIKYIESDEREPSKQTYTDWVNACYGLLDKPRPKTKDDE